MAKELDFSFTLPSDLDGYIEYECSFCKEVFRLNKNYFQGDKENNELFCPHCNIKSNVQNFYTTECVEYISQMKVYLSEIYLDKQLKDIVKKSKGLVKYKSKKSPVEPKLFGLHPGIEVKHYCSKCNESFKTEIGSNIVYCPYCGEIV